jgi:predicted membrane channel-forming protein YqfA (hemolysin III family)
MFFLIWAPTLLGLIFLVAAGILYAKVRSPALAFFFFGALVTTLAPWAFQLIDSTEYSRPLVMVLGFTVQVLGFLFYALSVPKRARET